MALRRADHEVVRTAMTAISDIRALFTKPGADPSTAVVPDEIFTRLAGLPVLLRTSGLLPTLAFYTAKGGTEKPVERAYATVGAALRGQVAHVLGFPGADGATPLDREFLSDLTDRLLANPHDLIRATRQLEEFTGWTRRLAEALKREQAASKDRAERRQDKERTGA